MARNRTATEILTAARERADLDQPGSGPALVDDTEGLERINGALGSLWDLLVGAGGEHLLVTNQQQAGVAAPTWPTDLLQLLAIEISDDSGATWQPMHRIDVRDIYAAKPNSGQPTHYAFTDTLESTPTVLVWPQNTAATYYYRIWYVPEPAVLTDGADTIRLPSRWHTWLELEVAIDMLAKEESDTTVLERKQQRVQQTILNLATRRDAYRSNRVRDARGVLRRGSGRPEHDVLYRDRWGGW